MGTTKEGILGVFWVILIVGFTRMLFIYYVTNRLYPNCNYSLHIGRGRSAKIRIEEYVQRFGKTRNDPLLPYKRCYLLFNNLLSIL